MKLWYLHSLTTMFAVLSTVASAEVLMTCHEPMGKLYVVGEGWVDDGYTGGVFQLVLDGEDYDIFVTDANGTRSSKADGAVIIVTEKTGNAITLVAAFPRALETYLFDFSAKQMIHTKQKISVGPSRGGVYRAKCD